MCPEKLALIIDYINYLCSDQIIVHLAMASGGLQTFVNKVKSHAREFADSLTPVLKVNDLRMS